MGEEKYTALDILECCGLANASAPRRVRLAAEVVAACQEGRVVVNCGSHNSHGSMRPGTSYKWDQGRYKCMGERPCWPRSIYCKYVQSWAEPMAEEMGIELDVVWEDRYEGMGCAMIRPYDAHIWTELPNIGPDESEASSEWWLGTEWPLGRKRAKK